MTSTNDDAEATAKALRQMTAMLDLLGPSVKKAGRLVLMLETSLDPLGDPDVQRANIRLELLACEVEGLCRATKFLDERLGVIAAAMERPDA